MNTIIKLALVATLAIFAQNVSAQGSPTQTKEEKDKQEQIAFLKTRKTTVVEDWKSTLKYRVKEIMALAKERGLSQEETEKLKKEAAGEVALNIENELAILDNQIALVERTGYLEPERPTSLEIGLGDRDSNGNRVIGIAYNSNKSEKKVYDRRSYGEAVFATGLNNVTSDNTEVGDDFSIGRSNFFEFGYAWKTRVFKNSGALQFKYGLSLQSNKVFTRRNETIVLEDGTASLQEFPFELRKAQIRTTNLVLPLHFEFGGWKKEQGEDYVRYRTAGKFRMGIGGYAGLRLGTQQKLKFRGEDGERVKSKSRIDLGGDNFVVGLSSYIRLTGDLSLYGKFDLTSAFTTRDLGDVNNVSLGLRLDL